MTVEPRERSERNLVRTQITNTQARCVYDTACGTRVLNTATKGTLKLCTINFHKANI